ncbi:hypothetical protein IV500_13195 [Paeniglutamicibacter antarcticus]|uniref:Uncharacterized protein n=1 Tax=Arthrobacter terrae TaxID=2935737 RepID=A0A931G516_9MICC|nr:hypothetical protein [Arthrobacter terrae]MBG0740336.1 hypothetical protein [Arthrobacter terrae]
MRSSRHPPSSPGSPLLPLLHLPAGPKGAGKSSYVRDVLKPATGLPFINAGEITASL